MINSLVYVALGGAIGASGRYLTNVGAGRLFGTGFPYGTMIVNIVGSFAMGCLFLLLAQKGGTAKLGPFLMTGVLGGFTTFSAFSLDAVTLYERGAVMTATGYVLGSVVLSIFALFAGMSLMRWVLA